MKVLRTGNDLKRNIDNTSAKKPFCLHSYLRQTLQNRLKRPPTSFPTPEQKQGLKLKAVLQHTQTQPIAFLTPLYISHSKSVVLQFTLCKTSLFDPFLHTFRHRKTTNNPRLKSKRNVLSWPTQRAAFANALRFSGKGTLFRAVFRH